MTIENLAIIVASATVILGIWSFIEALRVRKQVLNRVEAMPSNWSWTGDLSRRLSASKKDYLLRRQAFSYLRLEVLDTFDWMSEELVRNLEMLDSKDDASVMAASQFISVYGDSACKPRLISVSRKWPSGSRASEQIRRALEKVETKTA